MSQNNTLFKLGFKIGNRTATMTEKLKFLQELKILLKEIQKEIGVTSKVNLS